MLTVRYQRKVPQVTFFGCLKDQPRVVAAHAVFAIVLLSCHGALAPADLGIESAQTDVERCRYALLNPLPGEVESGYLSSSDDACRDDGQH